MLSSSILITIALIDYTTKRIPNLLVLALLVAALAEGRATISLKFMAGAVFALAVFARSSRCGMGDVKLSLVCISVIIGQARLFQYLTYLLVFSLLSLTIHLVRYRDIKGNIAFAPALCGAVLALRALGPM